VHNAVHLHIIYGTCNVAEDSVKDVPTVKRDSTMIKTAEEGKVYLGEDTREKTRNMTSSTDSSTSSIAGVKVFYYQMLSCNCVIHCALK